MSVSYKKTSETLSTAGQKTSAAFSTLGSAITRKFGDMRYIMIPISPKLCHFCYYAELNLWCRLILYHANSVERHPLNLVALLTFPPSSYLHKQRKADPSSVIPDILSKFVATDS